MASWRSAEEVPGLSDTTLLPHLVADWARRMPHARALTHGADSLTYSALQMGISGFASALVGLGIRRADRVGIYLDKRFETVVAAFGAAAAGGVFVPLNPLLKAEQVEYILRDCNVRVLVTSAERLRVAQGSAAAVSRPTARRRGGGPCRAGLGSGGRRSGALG